jgi:hypothetical protein
LTCVKPEGKKLPRCDTLSQACDDAGPYDRRSSFEFREASMTPSPQENQADNGEMASLLLGAGFALASLIILPAVAQRIGLGSSLTIALRGALMRAANRV